MMRDDWVEAKVGIIAELFRGISYKKDQVSKTECDGYLPILRANNIDGSLNFNDLVYLPKSIVKDNQYIKKGDIIFAMSSGSKHLVGKSSQAKNDIEGSFGAFCALLRPSNYISKEYIAYFFHSTSFRKLISEIAKGTNINNLKREHILNFIISLAPFPEQRAIVAKIEQLISKLDNGIANLKKAKEKLEIYRQALLKKAFEGELTKKWREQQTNLSSADELLRNIKEERLKRYEEQLKEWEKACKEGKVNSNKKPSKPKKPKFIEAVKFEDTKVDKIPNNWTLTELQNISDLVTDGTHHTPTYTSKGVKFISVKDIYDEQVHFNNCKYVSEETHKKLIKRCNPEFGDLMVTKSGTIGRLAIVPKEEFSLFVSVALIKLQSANFYLHPKWIYYAVKFHISGLNIEQDIKGGLLKNYHLEDLRVAKIILAPYSEQKQVVHEIENRLSVCDNILANIDEGLEKAEALRQSILKKAFEGKLLTEEELEACRKEPDWEPAAKLLERIKKTRNEEAKNE